MRRDELQGLRAVCAEEGADVKVFVINWNYSDGSAFGLVGVYDPELGKQILALLEEHSVTKQFIGVEVEVVGA